MGRSAKKIIWLIPVLVFAKSICITHAQNLEQELESYIESIRAERYVEIPPNLLSASNESKVVDLVSKYVSDSIPRVRGNLYILIGRVGMQSKKGTVRIEAVNTLLRSKSDDENLGVILSRLSPFSVNDFDEVAKDSVRSLFKSKPNYYDQVIRLVGFLQIRDLSQDLKIISGPSTKSQKIRWSALLALARMEDADAMSEVIKRTSRLPLNDDIVYEIFPDLIYTRQRPAIDHLFEVILSDEKKCTTADAGDDTSISCAYRVMEQVAPVINNFPVGLDESGDLKTKDYQKTLVKVRSWIVSNRTKYSIKQDIM